MNQPKAIRVVAAVALQEGRYLITQRRPNGSLPLLWEFPGGRVEAGESDEAALKRELQERLGARFQIGERIGEKTHKYHDYHMHLVLYSVTLDAGQTLQTKRVHAFEWVPPSELGFYRFPDADQQAMELLDSSNSK